MEFCRSSGKSLSSYLPCTIKQLFLMYVVNATTEVHLRFNTVSGLIVTEVPQIKLEITIVELFIWDI